MSPDQSTGERPAASVIIPNCNGGLMLLECVRSIAQGLGQSLEIILVDNSSTDSSVESVTSEFPDVKVIRNDRNLGFAVASNQGAKQASGRWLLFLNNDAVILQGSVAGLIKNAESHPSAAIVQPAIVRVDGSIESTGDLFTATGFMWHQTETPIRPISIFAAMGACMLVRSHLFEALGGFRDSYFAYFEEADLCWRVRMAGWDVMVVPAIRVLHKSGTTTRKVLSPATIYYLSYRNRLRSIVANCSPRWMLKVLPLHLMACLSIAAAFALKARWRVSMAILRAVVWPLLHPADVLGQRREAQSIRKVSDDIVFDNKVVVKMTADRARVLLSGNLTRW